MRYVLSHFAGERLVIAAFAVGIMEHLIEIGLEYASTRRVFGESLSDFQTWRHRFAEMATRLETTRLLAYQAADLLDRAHPGGEIAVSMAKVHAAASVQFVAAEILQLHGGYGQIEESPIPPLLPRRRRLLHRGGHVGDPARDHRPASRSNGADRHE